MRPRGRGVKEGVGSYNCFRVPSIREREEVNMLYLIQEARDKEMMTDSLFLLSTGKGQEGAPFRLSLIFVLFLNK